MREIARKMLELTSPVKPPARELHAAPGYAGRCGTGHAIIGTGLYNAPNATESLTLVYLRTS
jgi:hypothetical protein